MKNRTYCEHHVDCNKASVTDTHFRQTTVYTASIKCKWDLLCFEGMSPLGTCSETPKLHHEYCCDALCETSWKQKEVEKT